MDLTQQQLAAVLDLLAANIGSLALEVTLHDETDGAVLHEESDSGHLLVLTVRNTSGKTVVVHALQGKPTHKNANFSVEFINNSFYFDSPPQIYPVSSGSWEAGHNDIGNGYLTKIFLSATQELILKPGKDLTVKLAYRGAYAATREAVAVNVTVIATEHVTVDSLPATGHWDRQLDLLEDAGLPNPLLTAVAGPRTVLNDGGTSGTSTQVKISILNPYPGPLDYEKPAAAGEKTPTCFRVRVPLSNQVDAGWALCTPNEAANLSLTGLPQDMWTIDPQTSATEKSWTVRPVYEKNKSFPAEGALQLTLAGLKSSLAPGFADVLIDLANFPRYGTQTRVVELEKSPLIYRSEPHHGLLTAGAKGANTALEIQADTTQRALMVTQKGTGPAAEFAGTVRVAQAGDGPAAEFAGTLRVAQAGDGPAAEIQGRVRVEGGILARGGAPGAHGEKNNGYAFLGPGDNDSGMYSHENDHLALYTAARPRISLVHNQVGIGTEQPVSRLHVQGVGASKDTATLYITNSSGASLFCVRDDGTVGIGTTKPEARLHVAQGDLKLDSNTEIRSADQNHRILFRQTEKKLELRELGDIVFSPGATAGNETAKVVMTHNGKVGIGTNTPEAMLSFGKTLQEKAIGLWDDPKEWFGLGVQPGQMRLQVGNSASRFSFLGGSSKDSKEVVSILASGSVGIGTRNPEQKLHLEGSAYFTGGLVMNADLWVQGNIHNQPPGAGRWLELVADGGGSWWADAYWSSDERLKKQIRPIGCAMEKVARLSGVHFRWNARGLNELTRGCEKIYAGPEASKEENRALRKKLRAERKAELSGPQVGVLGQEVQAVLPEAVKENENGYLQVDYPKLVALLIEAVKEQKALFDVQAAEIRALRARLDALENGIA